MPETRQGDSRAQSALDRAIEGGCMRVRLPIVGQVTLPPPERLAYFAAIGVLAAIDLIEWPVALVIVTGHVLAAQRWSRVARGLGDALEEA